MGYNGKSVVMIEDIIAFHAEFEKIHPFQDGNGRVGRLIALKECLRHNIVPFLIEDSKKTSYSSVFSVWERRHVSHIGQWLQQPQEEWFPFFLRFTILTIIIVTIPARIRAAIMVPRFSASQVVISYDLSPGQCSSADPILCIF